MRYVLVVAAALGAVGLAGCSAGPGPLFDNENGAPSLTCMTHQADVPSARYTNPDNQNTAEILTMMRYYTANGAKPYCDGKPATETDTRWAKFYLDMGGMAQKVTVARAATPASG